jgi:signal transduction histidine kinase
MPSRLFLSDIEGKITITAREHTESIIITVKDNGGDK